MNFIFGRDLDLSGESRVLPNSLDTPPPPPSTRTSHMPCIQHHRITNLVSFLLTLGFLIIAAPLLHAADAVPAPAGAGSGPVPAAGAPARPAPTAQLERLTLSDGRVLVGIYNDATHSIRTTTGSLTADISLAKATVVSREPVASPPPTTDHEADSAATGHNDPQPVTTGQLAANLRSKIADLESRARSREEIARLPFRPTRVITYGNGGGGADPDFVRAEAQRQKRWQDDQQNAVAKAQQLRAEAAELQKQLDLLALTEGSESAMAILASSSAGQAEPRTNRPASSAGETLPGLTAAETSQYLSAIHRSDQLSVAINAATQEKLASDQVVNAYRIRVIETFLASYPLTQVAFDPRKTVGQTAETMTAQMRAFAIYNTLMARIMTWRQARGTASRPGQFPAESPSQLYQELAAPDNQQISQGAGKPNLPVR